MALMRRDDRIEQIVLLAVLAVLIVGCIIVLRPFLAALLWALILAIATWPTFEWFSRRFHGRPTLAAAAMTSLLCIALLVPIFVVGTTAAETVSTLPDKARSLFADGVPPPPLWLIDVPMVGHWAFEQWTAAALEPGRLAEPVKQAVGPVAQWLLSTGSTLGGGVLELVLSFLATFFVYRDGAAGGQTLGAIGEKLAGEQARALIEVAEETMKSVVYGLIGTALAQGVLAAIGFWIAGVPGAFFWGLVTFLIAIFPIGAPLIWIPAAGWLLLHDGWQWALFMVLWGALVVSSIDNFLKPYFISRGTTMPILFIFLGVVGGVLAFGLLGLFIGPTLLAVVYTIVREWSSRSRQAQVQSNDHAPEQAGA